MQDLSVCLEADQVHCRPLRSLHSEETKNTSVFSVYKHQMVVALPYFFPKYSVGIVDRICNKCYNREAEGFIQHECTGGKRL